MTDPTAAELDAICARLTKAQREAAMDELLSLRRGVSRVRRQLFGKGLVQANGLLTPLGVATRKRLIKRMQHD